LPRPGGNAFAGGFYLRTCSACLPLVFRAGRRSPTVHFGLGRPLSGSGLARVGRTAKAAGGEPMASGAPAIEGGSHASGPAGPVVSPSERQLVWRRLRRDRVAMASGCLVLLVLVLCFVVGPILVRTLGHGPDTLFPYGSSTSTLKPVGPWSWVPDQTSPLPVPTAHTDRVLFVLGADGPLGRDELMRLLAGGRVSLEIAIIGALIALAIGVTLGLIAGFFGGLIDSLVSRSTELIMAFPLLLLLIALGQTISNRIDFVTLGVLEQGVLSLGVVIGLFTWFYPARIVRALVLSLREREYVDAARALGASDAYIMRRHLLPQLTGPILVWGTIILATNIILESALSFLNIGVRLPTPSWGNLISANIGSLLGYNPGASPLGVRSNWPMMWPTGMLLLTALSLVLLGEGLRTAIDPRADA
jgi:peptide/nickel transport system permease protein